MQEIHLVFQLLLGKSQLKQSARQPLIHQLDAINEMIIVYMLSFSVDDILA
jgi:hypothetical protein